MKEYLKIIGLIIIVIMSIIIIWDYGRHFGQSEWISLCERGIKIEKIAEDIYTFRPVTAEEYSQRNKHYWKEIAKLREKLSESNK